MCASFAVAGPGCWWWWVVEGGREAGDSGARPATMLGWLASWVRQGPLTTTNIFCSPSTSPPPPPSRSHNISNTFYISRASACFLSCFSKCPINVSQY